MDEPWPQHHPEQPRPVQVHHNDTWHRGDLQSAQPLTHSPVRMPNAYGSPPGSAAAGLLGVHELAVSKRLDASVRAGLSIVVSGGTQAGKTTMLNCLLASIPGREQVSCEEVFERAAVRAAEVTQIRWAAGPRSPHSRSPGQRHESVFGLV
jgi:hypothetical protein